LKVKQDTMGFTGHRVIAAATVENDKGFPQRWSNNQQYPFSILGVSESGSLVHGTSGEVLYSAANNNGVRAIDIAAGDEYCVGLSVLILDDGSIKAFRVSREPYTMYGRNGTGKPACESVQWIHDDVTCDASGMHPIVGPRFKKKGEDYDVCEDEFEKLSESQKKSYVRIERPGGPSIDVATGKQKKKASDDMGEILQVKIAPVTLGSVHSGSPESVQELVACTTNGLWQMSVGTSTGMCQPSCILEQEGILEFDLIRINSQLQVIYFIDAEGRLNSFLRTLAEEDEDEEDGQEIDLAPGANLLGRVATSRESMQAPTVVTMGSSSPRIIDVATGTEHVVAVTEAGSVYTWGVDTAQMKTGKLATPHHTDSVLPRLALAGSATLGAEKCYASDSCSMILTRDERLMSAGLCEDRMGAKTRGKRAKDIWGQFTELNLPAHLEKAGNERFPVAVELNTHTALVMYQHFDVEYIDHEDVEPMAVDDEDEIEEALTKKAKLSSDEEISTVQQDLAALQMAVASLPPQKHTKLEMESLKMALQQISNRLATSIMAEEEAQDLKVVAAKKPKAKAAKQNELAKGKIAKKGKTAKGKSLRGKGAKVAKAK